MKKIRFIAIMLVFIQVAFFLPMATFAEELSTESIVESSITDIENTTVNIGLTYLEKMQYEHGAWREYGKLQTAEITNILEYICNKHQNTVAIQSMISDATDYFYVENTLNIDELSRYILIDDIHDERYITALLKSQNPDGGFGLVEGYTSDIIDTKLALKTLADLGEVEAMTKAAYYITTLQNDDGGFGYQQGLASNAELTAEIADILADCMSENVYLSYVMSDTINKLTEYLDVNAVPIDELSADNLSAVYQHFHTALFKFKINGRYDVTPYYELQNENGGVFDDPMTTALFLELIVREQNSIVANLDYISITNDRGYAVSAFNANENVNIEISNEYETEKAYLQVMIETPSGEEILLDSENLLWNTADNEEGTYTVSADIIRKSNGESLISMTQTFRIEHRLEIDGIVLELSQGFARVGDEIDVGVSANIELTKFSEESDHVTVRWSVSCGDEITLTDEKIISESDLMADFIPLGDFTPDTSDRKVYLITAEVLSNELVVAQSTANFFISTIINKTEKIRTWYNKIKEKER